ncbi:hypothetical protein [Bacteroides thetaiotaomicron]|uniref:hypothetical protein n=1 Tax=Bacteroides thetaiotaomicron TaxID=818 RepID=UPI00286E9573|nr:hypothetical protein [Bacteroides thetaiotaomicron]MCS2264258.1 hypothetical protein [Bacteroides thetaiotaomicron]
MSSNSSLQYNTMLVWDHQPPNVGSHTCNTLSGYAEVITEELLQPRLRRDECLCDKVSITWHRSFSYLDMIRGFSKIDGFFARS